MTRPTPRLLTAPLLAATLLAAAALPASAAPPGVTARVYYHAGSWDAFTAQAPGRPAMCGIGSRAMGEQRAFTLRYEAGGHQLLLRADKPSWSIPAGTQVSVVMQIGQNPPWQATATGNGRQIDWTLPATDSQNFEGQFRQAERMTLSFPGGNEPVWVLALNGSSAITDAFNRCVGQITAPPPPGPTQPYAAPAAQ